MKTQYQIFFDHFDEIEFSSLLKKKFPEIIFLDDNVWKSQPITRETIAACLTPRCYIFNQPLELLPTILRRDGQVEGPIVGPVIQFLRCKIDGTTIFSGSVAASFDPNRWPAAPALFNLVKETTELLCGRYRIEMPNGQFDDCYRVSNRVGENNHSGGLQLVDRATKLPLKLCSV